MECTCVRQTDVPGTSRLFSDLVYHYDRVQDLYPFAPNQIDSLKAAARFDFPDERRAALVRALGPLNAGNPSLEELAKPGTVAVVTGQQVGLFSGPAYTVYKALTAIRAARELTAAGIPAVPVFWLATEDHDFAEVDHVWMFGADNQPRKIRMEPTETHTGEPVGGIPLSGIPIAAMRETLAGLPFAEDAVALIEAAYAPGETMGSAFAAVIRKLFGKYGLLLIDPMEAAVREIAAPLMKEAVERMPELAEALVERSRNLVARGYHAQVMVDSKTSLVFLLEGGQRIALRRSGRDFIAGRRKISSAELAGMATQLSPNALLRPVAQDYLLPTAAYIGGPAELAYFAQSEVLYRALAGRQPAAFPRAGFTLVDERARKQTMRYHLAPTDLFQREDALYGMIAERLVPTQLRQRLDDTQTAFGNALDALSEDLQRFDITLANALETSRRKIEYQAAKIARKTAKQIMARDEQAVRDAHSLSGLVFPEKHLQERLYSIIPFIAKFGPGLIDEIYPAVRVECPDHQFAVV